MVRYSIRFLLCLVLLGWGVSAGAILKIEITKGVEAGLPIAVAPFSWEGDRSGQNVSDIIEADLLRSGRFDSLPRADFLSTPHDDKEISFKDWRLIKAEALVVGKVRQRASGKYRVQFQLFDVFKGVQLAGYRYTVSAKQLRRVAHRISDIIYEKLTGEPGAFDTRIAYVTAEKSRRSERYLLQVADFDGYNAQTILDSPEPIMSPAWSPDGRQLAYVSFENRRSMVFVQNVMTRRRTKVADYNGLNSAPAWSPDGRRLALVLSRDGNPEIYVLDLNGGELQRLTRHQAIDTEPTWSPDGKHIVFTSDRSGKPQLYRMTADGREVRRLTFEGGYNARPTYSADGKMLAFVHGDQGKYHIAVLYLENLTLHVLTDAPLDESPSFAPNGRMILYATERRGHGVLAAVSSDGRVKQLLRLQEGDVREPAWSPFNRKF